ncbi:hypothetical protein RJT34_16035 [Clitoria ternatea]|uniref:Uncharacterized protein n=1 Tax=Clitoria ternatea TaxID=43366 RepID=A0AAN9J8G6_CLITE
MNDHYLHKLHSFRFASTIIILCSVYLIFANIIALFIHAVKNHSIFSPVAGLGHTIISLCNFSLSIAVLLFEDLSWMGFWTSRIVF